MNDLDNILKLQFLSLTSLDIISKETTYPLTWPITTPLLFLTSCVIKSPIFAGVGLSKELKYKDDTDEYWDWVKTCVDPIDVGF